MPKQLSFILSDKFKSILSGGFGNGKTEALCWRAILLSLLYPNALGLIGRATYPELRDSTIRSFMEVCPPELILEYKKNEHMFIMQNGANIVFRAFDDPRKILSMNLGWVGIDQIEEISEELFLQILGRLRSNDCRFVFGVCNPEPGWAKTKFKDQMGKDVDLFMVEATTMENPHIPKDYIDNLLKSFPQHWINRYCYGDWNTFEGQIFSEYAEAKHVIDPFEIPKGWKKTYVIDYGYRNPFACLEFVVDYDENYYITQEHYEAEKVISYHAEKIKALGCEKGSLLLIDPSCSAKTHEKNGVQVSYIDEFNECGLYPIPANNNIAGLMRANQWFKEDRLKIFRNCTNTITEVGGLRWKKIKPNWNNNLPETEEDKDNHTTDCIKYYVNSRISSPSKPKPANWLMLERENKLKKIGRYSRGDWYNGN